MNITFSQLPAVMRALEEAIAANKLHLALDARLSQLSAADVHVYAEGIHAEDFAEFNRLLGKPIELLPTDTTLYFLREQLSQELHGGNTHPVIVVTPAIIREIGEIQQGYFIRVELEEQMDGINWNKIFYDPLEANTEAESDEDKMMFRHLEWLVEQLSGYAQRGELSRQFVADLVHRHWDGKPMGTQITDVLNGVYTNKEQLFYKPKNVNDMNQDNVDYLKKQLFFLDFGEGLHTHLERRIKEGLPDFQLQAAHEFGKDKMEAVLHFTKSKQEGSDMYFFNKYDATLYGQNGTVDHTFYINNKGKSLGFEDACQLLNGRSVFMEVTNKQGETAKAWIKIDFANKDENGHFKLNYFKGDYNYNLHEAVGRIPLKEMGNPEKMEAMYNKLQQGKMAEATLVKGGKEVPVQIAADPKFKTIKMYDMDGVKLFVPGPKQEAGYGVAPADAKKQASGQQLEVGQPLENGKAEKNDTVNTVKPATTDIKKKDLLGKPAAGNDLMPKNRVRKGKGVGIA